MAEDDWSWLTDDTGTRGLSLSDDGYRNGLIDSFSEDQQGEDFTFGTNEDDPFEIPHPSSSSSSSHMTSDASSSFDYEFTIPSPSLVHTPSLPSSLPLTPAPPYANPRSPSTPSFFPSSPSSLSSSSEPISSSHSSSSSSRSSSSSSSSSSGTFFLSPPSSSSSSEVGATLAEMESRMKSYDETLMEIKKKQCDLLLKKVGSHDALVHIQSQLANAIQSDAKLLNRLMSSEILRPSYLNRRDRFSRYLRLQFLQLEIFSQELKYFSSHDLSKGPGQHPIFARLVIASQPISGVITKGKTVEEAAILVKLLFGATVRFSSVSHMTVSAIWEDQQARIASGEKNIFESESQPLDVSRFQTQWRHKFTTGTRKTLVFLRYSLTIRVSDSSPLFEVQSELSSPFIVITNDCQWYEAEGKLLQNELFKQGPVPWPYLANTVQRRFIEATKQDPSHCSRPLFLSDFNYFLQGLLGGGKTVTLAQFDRFWDWFGKCLQRLRYQRHVGPLFIQGYLQGFLAKQTGLSILASQQPGTFLIRFSERNPGNFAIAYRASSSHSSDSIRHYLLRPEDITGPKHTIVDFLGDQASLTHMLQIRPGPDGQPIVGKLIPKDELLGPMYAKKTQIPSADGYDTRIQVVKSIIE